MTFFDEVMADGPLAWWRLNNNWDDESGNGRSPNPNFGAYSWNTEGSIEGDSNVSLHALGTANLSYIPNPLWIPTFFSVHVRIRTTALGIQTIFGRDIQGSWLLRLEDGLVKLIMPEQSKSVSSGTVPVNDGEWQSVVIVAGADEVVRVYVGGVEVGNLSSTTITQKDWFSVGTGWNGTGDAIYNPFLGDMDEMIFLPELSAARVLAYHEAAGGIVPEPEIPEITANFSGSGTLSTAVSVVGETPPVEANFYSNGTLSAAISVVASALAPFSGSGTLSAEVESSGEEVETPGDLQGEPLVVSGLPDQLYLDMTPYTLSFLEDAAIGVVKTLWIDYQPNGDAGNFQFQSDQALTSIRIWDDSGNLISDTQGPISLVLPALPHTFQVGHYEGQSPEVELAWLDITPPLYNDFESPFDLDYDYGGEFLDMHNSTMVEIEPNYIDAGGSIWAKWNSEEDTTVSFSVEGAPSDLPFTVTVFDNDLLTPIETITGAGALEFDIDIQDGHNYWMQFVVADPTDFGVELSWLLAGELVEPAEAVNYIRAEVYRPDGLTMIAEVARRSGVSGQEPLNVAGAGSISVNLDDKIFDNHPDLFAWGNIVKFWLGTLCIHGFRIKTRSTTYVSTDEWKGYVRTVSGPSVQHLMDDFMVQHNLILQNRRLDTRAFTWYAPEGAWYDELDWVTNYNTNSQQDPPGPQNIPANKRPKWNNPPKFPDENARWMWVSPLAERNEDNFQPPPLMGQRYFRKEFSLQKRTLVKMYASSDEKYKVYLDGEEVLTGDGEETGFTEMQTRKLTLTPGRHIIAIRGAQFSQEEIYEKREIPKPEKLDNTEDARDGDGDGIINEGTPQEGPAPAKEETEEPDTIKVRLDDGVDAILFTMMRLDERGKPTSTIVRSNENWRTTYERPVPAWNRANVLRRVVNEARDRGNAAAEMLTFGFDNERDSMNRRWKDRWNSEVGIGTSALELQSLLSEGNNFDVWVRPSDLVIRAWRRRGRDLSKSITLEPGRNLLDWSVEETEEVKNDYLVQYDGGWFKWRHQNSAERYGARESFITMGHHKNDKDAAKVLQRAARGIASAVKRAGTDDFKTWAEGQPSGSILAVTGARPFLDFGVGDVIKAPNENGVLKRHRVLSLSFMEDDNSFLTYDAELEEI